MKKSLPTYIVTKATILRQQLETGQHWSQLGGRKLHTPDLRVVFELPSFYRLVCWFQDGALYRIEAMSHERYNTIASNTRR